MSMLERLQTASRRALEARALSSLETETVFVREGPIEFIIRIAKTLGKKPIGVSAASSPTLSVTNNSPVPVPAKGEQGHGGQPAFNPFLPYDPNMFVKELPPGHVALLNKFAVVPNHFLVVTKEFESQTTPLTVRDLAAVWSSMRGLPSLAFFNCGEHSGASQPHKHIQVLPLPLSESRVSIPVDHLIPHDPSPGALFQVPEFPFLHQCALLGDLDRQSDAEAAVVLHGIYDRMMQDLSLYPTTFDLVGFAYLGTPVRNGYTSGSAHRDSDGSTDDSSESLVPPLRTTTAAAVSNGAAHVENRSYNLLMTHRWMLIVPRSRSDYGPVNVNSVGFAGTLLVKSSEALTFIREMGPLQILSRVARERSAPPPRSPPP